MLRQSDFYHVGIVTNDVDATAEKLGREMGLTWCPPIKVPLTVWTRDHGVMTLNACAVYSQQEPCIELVLAQPNSPWVPVEGRPFHHMGYWVDDLHAVSAALEARGCPKVICASDNGRMFGMAYHETHNGALLEIVDRKAVPDWKDILAGTARHKVVVPGQSRMG